MHCYSYRNTHKFCICYELNVQQSIFYYPLLLLKSTATIVSADAYYVIYLIIISIYPVLSFMINKSVICHRYKQPPIIVFHYLFWSHKNSF